MPIIHTAADCPQREVEWFKLRCGKVTASELDSLLTPEFKERTGETPRTYLFKKLAELWQGHALPGFTSFATEQGNIQEDEAIPWFRMEYEQHNVHFAGFVETDDGLAGCSPDALIGDDGGLEVKCPEAPNHVRYLIDGVLPKDYAAQVHMSMFVTGRPWWIFLSYRRKFPPFVLKVMRDETICARIGITVRKFHNNLNAAMDALRKADV
jgi:hypothetical protein